MPVRNLMDKKNADNNYFINCNIKWYLTIYRDSMYICEIN